MGLQDTVDDTALTRRQLSSLKGIIDGLMPPLSTPEKWQDETVIPDPKRRAAIRKFWECSLGNDSDFLYALQEAILRKLPPHESFQLRLLLSLLSTVVGSMILFATLSYRPFSQWSTAEQTLALKRLQESRFQDKRRIFNSLKRLVCGIAASFVPIDATGIEKKVMNPFWEACGYPGPYQSSMDSKEDEEMMRRGSSNGNMRAVESSLINITKDTQLDCDVVIVGSGAGGSVAASVLSAAGYSVIVLEKGPYIPRASISNLETDAFDKMYDTHGLLTSNDGNFMILAGSTLGGGPTINWSCCLPLPDRVRQEWVEQHGLRQFGDDKEFVKSLNMIMREMDCLDKSGVIHNAMNERLQQGLDILGYEWDVTGQNLRRSAGAVTGYVCFGDRYGLKNDSLNTFLSDAVQNGTQLVDKCRVQKILKETDVSSDGTKRHRAVGVMANVGQYSVRVHARKSVISAAGSLHTPCLLERSGFQNWHIGRHLHLHPVTAAIGFFDESTTVDCFLGAPLTTVCNEFVMGPKQDGYGARLECPSGHTGLSAAVMPHTTPEEHRDLLLRFRNALPAIVLQRDVSEGRVQCGGDGYHPCVDYLLNGADKESMTEALGGLVRVLVATGAKLVLTTHSRDSGIHFQNEDGRCNPKTKSEIENSQQVQEYLAEIKNRGMAAHEAGVFCAHQMGSCRMSSSPESGAVDENGETWECDDMYVMDASTFPTASGANPMCTTMGISHMLSRRLAMRCGYDDGTLASDSDIQQAKSMLENRCRQRQSRS